VNLISKIKEFSIPYVKNDNLIKLSKLLTGNINLGIIDVIPFYFCIENECHYNVNQIINILGGEKVLGYYYLMDANNSSNIIAIKHSVWKKNKRIIDITPSNLDYIIFSNNVIDDNIIACELYNDKLCIINQ
jgi:hypothetical protein